MIVEKGVDLKDLCPQIVKILPIIERVFDSSGNYLIIIASTWGRDQFMVAHNSGKAIDVKYPTKDSIRVTNKVARALGLNWKLIEKKTHIHIEYTPLGSKNIRSKTTKLL